MATIKDIAHEAGVSIATISNVLNGKKGAASPAKAKQITDIAEKLGYMPNSLARSLKYKKSNTIGVITEDLTVFNTPEIVDGIDAYCEDQNYEIIIENMRFHKKYNNDFTDTPAHKQLFDHMIRTTLAKQVEGIVYVGCHSREMPFLPSRVSVPFVYAYCYPQEEKYPAVLFDDEKAAFDVTDLLVARGNYRIGVLTGPAGSVHTQKRLLGYQKALHHHGILYNPELVHEGDWERESGYIHGDTLLNQGVTAIFVFNDLMASGIYESCAKAKIVVGEDISVFGFDNREISRGYTPALATVEPPLFEMGRRCGEILFQMLMNQKVLAGDASVGNTPATNKISTAITYLSCKIIERPSIC